MTGMASSDVGRRNPRRNICRERGHQLFGEPPIRLHAIQQRQPRRCVRCNNQAGRRAATSHVEHAAAEPGELLVAVDNHERTQSHERLAEEAGRESPLAIAERHARNAPSRGDEVRLQRFDQRRLARTVRADDLSPPIRGGKLGDEPFGTLARRKLKSQRARPRPAGGEGIRVSRRRRQICISSVGS